MVLCLTALPAVDAALWIVLRQGHLEPEVGRLVLGAATVACFYLLLAGIYAFDPASDLRLRSSARGRMLVGAASGVILSIIWQWPIGAAALAAVAAGALGHYGLAWAKYVHF